MSSIVLLLALTIASSSAQLRLVNIASQTVKSKISDVKQPIDTSLVSFGSSKCTSVKKLIGVDYEQMAGVTEPDLDQLTLNFVSDELQASFKLGSVAKTLPLTPGFNHKQPLVIFMHGFIDDPSLFNFPGVNAAFQSQGKYNILALNASPLIRFLYLRSSTYVRLIGQKLGQTLAAMVEYGLNPKDIHLVGHSLGAHISGFAGKSFFNTTGSLVGRITGLDPAGPCFTHVEEDLRLKASDAAFVDAIHSDAGVYGLTEPVGDVDFYPNGGAQQPNCMFQFCAHGRAVELFAESVRNPNAFPARACSSWEAFKNEQCSSDTSLMGYGCQPATKGIYYLRTGAKSPYGLGADGLLHDNEGLMKTMKTLTQNIIDLLL